MSVPPLNTRERILRQGLNLLSVSGLTGITIGLLAEETGLSKSGLFAHFGSKENLQLALLDQTALTMAEVVVTPALQAAEGLPRLQALINYWLGWTTRAGLKGGCPVAAGMFEQDDQSGPVRERLAGIGLEWYRTLITMTERAVELGHLQSGIDVEQFVWELSGIYLNHHVSVRFIHDPNADEWARRAVAGLIWRSSSEDQSGSH